MEKRSDVVLFTNNKSEKTTWHRLDTENRTWITPYVAFNFTKLPSLLEDNGTGNVSYTLAAVSETETTLSQHSRNDISHAFFSILQRTTTFLLN